MAPTSRWLLRHAALALAVATLLAGVAWIALGASRYYERSIREQCHDMTDPAWCGFAAGLRDNVAALQGAVVAAAGLALLAGALASKVAPLPTRAWHGAALALAGLGAMALGGSTAWEAANGTGVRSCGPASCVSVRPPPGMSWSLAVGLILTGGLALLRGVQLVRAARRSRAASGTPAALDPSR